MLKNSTFLEYCRFTYFGIQQNLSLGLLLLGFIMTVFILSLIAVNKETGFVQGNMNTTEITKLIQNIEASIAR